MQATPEQKRGAPDEPSLLDGVALSEARTVPEASRVRLRWFAAALLVAPFVFFAFGLGLMRSSLFVRRSHSMTVATTGYGMHLRNANCEILVYGDSSALVGVDPATVKAQTGLSTCNIAEFAGVTMLNGTMVVDSFLRHNPRPRYLIFLFSPDDMTPVWQNVGTYEGVLLRVREQPDFGLVRLILRHPDEVFGAAETSVRFALSWIPKRPMPAASFNDRIRQGGRMTDLSPPMSQCSASAVHAPDPQWIENLRKRYGVQGTTVLVDVAPVPACDPNLPTYRAEFTSRQSLRQQLTEHPAAQPVLVDNQVTALPMNWFEDGMRLHLEPDGQHALSTMLAQQIDSLRANGEKP